MIWLKLVIEIIFDIYLFRLITAFFCIFTINWLFTAKLRDLALRFFGRHIVLEHIFYDGFITGILTHYPRLKIKKIPNEVRISCKTKSFWGIVTIALTIFEWLPVVIVFAIICDLLILYIGKDIFLSFLTSTIGSIFIILLILSWWANPPISAYFILLIIMMSICAIIQKNIDGKKYLDYINEFLKTEQST